MAETKRRARGEDSIYYDQSRDRWTVPQDWLETLSTQCRAPSPATRSRSGT